MGLLSDRSIAAAEFCLSRSRTARLRERDARWLSAEAFAELSESGLRGEPDELRAMLSRRLSARIRETRNPAIAWLLIQILLPIIVRLVVEWWTKRKD